MNLFNKTKNTTTEDNSSDTSIPKQQVSIVEEERAMESTPSYLLPGILVTTLFFLWGFSYGLLDTLNKHFRNVLGICKLYLHLYIQTYDLT